MRQTHEKRIAELEKRLTECERQVGVHAGALPQVTDLIAMLAEAIGITVRKDKNHV